MRRRSFKENHLDFAQYIAYMLFLNSPMLASGMSGNTVKNKPYIDEAKPSQRDTPALGSGRVHSAPSVPSSSRREKRSVVTAVHLFGGYCERDSIPRR